MKKYFSILANNISKEQLQEILRIGYKEIFEEELKEEKLKIFD